jgi:drug/metabolite transporter (DMT)-like permease
MLIAAAITLPWTLRGLRATPLRARHAAPTLLAGALLAVHFATWITSLAYTSVAISVSLVSTTPLFVAAFAWLWRGVRPAGTVAIGASLAVVGGVAIAWRGETDGGVGALLAVVGAMAMAGYLLLGQHAQRQGLSTGAYVGVAYAVAAIVLAPLPALLGVSFVGYPPSTYGWIALLALVPQAIGHTGLNVALRSMDPTRVATATLLEPIGAGLLAAWLYREIPEAIALVGAATLLIGVAIAIRPNPSP